MRQAFWKFFPMSCVWDLWNAQIQINRLIYIFITSKNNCLYRVSGQGLKCRKDKANIQRSKIPSTYFIFLINYNICGQSKNVQWTFTNGNFYYKRKIFNSSNYHVWTHLIEKRFTNYIFILYHLLPIIQ